ncbi:2'-5' RNA ligase family protein [Kocuria tytonis]|uniref:2'-5' RNA ligase family protein n=1 Tax=Kocuria tytonis TaxID=2054280 RepID=A0A495AAJ5_9MICC|nr:2'-5' RNA ligase family protein [Kocuria tytonis]RKQ37028.1 hypothetical protein C1C97_005420 [Kocuria tytonis]
MPAHSLDLVLTAADDALIRARWSALQDAGLPSLAAHRGASNAPRLTVVTAPAFSEDVLERTRALFTGLLPCSLPVPGLTLLGSGPYVLAQSLAAPSDLVAAVEELQRLTADPARPPRPWAPHVTLAKRLDAAAVGRALEVLDDVAAPGTLEVTALRRWDPQRGVTSTVVP